MGNTTNKALAAKTRKAWKMDALEANRRENLRVGQEYKWGDYVPYAQRQVESVTRKFARDQLAHYGIDLPVETGSLGQAESVMVRTRKQRNTSARRLRNVQLAQRWNDQDICDVFYREEDNYWVCQWQFGRMTFRDRAEAVNYANRSGYVKEVSA